MNYILFDDATRFQLFPFTHTRPIADIRCGIITMRERWEKLLKATTSTLTDSYLQPVYHLSSGNDNLLINASIFANDDLAKEVSHLKEGRKLMQEDVLIAARFSNAELHFHNLEAHVAKLTPKSYESRIYRLQNSWDIFSQNERAIREDFDLLTKGKKSQEIPKHVIVTGKHHLFMEEGAVIHAGCIARANKSTISSLGIV